MDFQRQRSRNYFPQKDIRADVGKGWESFSIPPIHRGKVGIYMKESLTNGDSILAVEDEPVALTATEEESQEVLLNCPFDVANFYEPAVDMKEWL